MVKVWPSLNVIKWMIFVKKKSAKIQIQIIGQFNKLCPVSSAGRKRRLIKSRQNTKLFIQPYATWTLVYYNIDYNLYFIFFTTCML